MCTHDDVIKWKHFPRYWTFVPGIHRSRWIPRTKASDAELWCFLWSAPKKSGWVNIRGAGDLRRHRAHYDVIVMLARSANIGKVGWYQTKTKLDHFNTFTPRQNGRHIVNDNFNVIFLNENLWILKKISLKYNHKGPIAKKTGLVHIMAWQRTDDKPLSEPTIECFTYAYMRHSASVA